MLQHPSFHETLGYNVAVMLMEALEAGGYPTKGSAEDGVFNDLNQVVPVVIQCFEWPTVQYLSTLTTLPLVCFCVTYAQTDRMLYTILYLALL